MGYKGQRGQEACRVMPVLSAEEAAEDVSDDVNFPNLTSVKGKIQ